MVFKLGELQAVVDALQGILTQRLPVKAAYWLGKFLRKAQEELQEFQAGRIRLCEQYCRKDAKGEPVKMIEGGNGALVEAAEGYQGVFRYDFAHLTAEERQALDNEFKELTETEVTFDLKPLTLDQLGDKVEATAEEMAALQPLIVEGPPA
jgi:hypothetical protein